MAQRKKPKSGVAQAPAQVLNSTEHVERVQGICCHGLISEDLAKEIIVQIRAGNQSVEGAIEQLQEDCTCGLFLPSRARRILNAAIAADV